MRDEIVLYQPDNLTAKVKVRVEDEIIRLTQAQIVALFDSSKANISEHIKHIFRTGELDKIATVRDFRTVRKEGELQQKVVGVFFAPTTQCSIVNEKLI